MPRGKKNEQTKDAKPVRSGQKKKRNSPNKENAIAAAEQNTGKAPKENRRKKTKTDRPGEPEPKEKISIAAASKNKRIAKWESAESLVLLEGWARDGLSMEQIARNMGIAKDTLYRWLKISSDISDAIKKGKDVTDYLVENALFTSALTGNVVAQIFWLKNRKPDKWKDKVEQVIDTEADTGGIVLLAPVLEKNHEPTEESDMGTTTETD